VQIRHAQKLAWAKKLAKGFNTTDVPLEGVTFAEIAEAFTAWRDGGEGLGGELADTAIFLVCLAEMTRHDLDAEVRRHLASDADGSVAQISDAQALACSKRLAIEPGTGAVSLAFGELTSGLGTAFIAWRRGEPSVGTALATAFTALTVLAGITGRDLDAEIERKLAINARRAYSAGPNGILVKASDA